MTSTVAPHISIEQATHLLTDLARRHHVPAAQLTVLIDGLTVSVAMGAVNVDAKFPVGSITKACTATLAMLLVSDGDLDLDDPDERVVLELQLRLLTVDTPRGTS